MSKAITKEMVFKTSDGTKFEGDGAQREAELHQFRLNRLDEIRDYVDKTYPDASQAYRTRVANIIADWEVAAKESTLPKEVSDAAA